MRNLSRPGPGPAPDYVRVSCATVALLELASRRVLLLASKHLLEQAQLVLVPPGGAIEGDPAVIQALAAVLEDEQNPELRLWLPRESLPRFRSWFESRCSRETDPVRELIEELVDETHLLSALAPSEIKFRLLDTREFWYPSRRRRAQGENTFYLHEIFRVWLAGPRVTELRAALAQRTRLAQLVAPDEILARRARDGTQVGDHARALLSYL